METAHRLRGTLPELEIVFITSLTGYALESYEVAALDYLVKPVSYPRFCRSLERACRRICQQAEHILTIKNNDGVFRLRAKDLVYVEVFSHRLVLHTTAGDVSYSGNPCRTGKGFRKRIFPLPQLLSDQSGAGDPAGRC